MTVLPLPLFAAGEAPSRRIEDRRFILEMTGVCLGISVDDPASWLAVVQIIWIDLLLSGDNAVVIALACGKLRPQHRA